MHLNDNSNSTVEIEAKWDLRMSEVWVYSGGSDQEPAGPAEPFYFRLRVTFTNWHRQHGNIDLYLMKQVQGSQCGVSVGRSQ